MIRIFSEVLVALSASPAISLVAKGTVVLALGLTSTWFARSSRAAVRHALLASTFGVLLALPIVSFLATPVPISVPVAIGDSNIWPLFDNASIPSFGEPTAVHFSDTPAQPGWSLFRLSTMLFYGWFIGAAIFMMPVIRGLLEIRSLRRLGLPWRHGQAVADGLATGVHRRVEVLLHESLVGPMTCGVLRPLIVLPAEAHSWDEQDLERAVVHESEHVRRYDWAIHCLARLACAAYWFHPLVWTAWRQLKLEAERSSDDAVLRSSEATAYADQLVGLARRRSGARKSPVLVMASRSDLAARVGALLDGSQRRGPVGALMVAAACIAAASVVLTMSPLRMVAAPQSAAPPPASEASSVKAAESVRFEVASVKPASPEEIQAGVSGIKTGHGRATGTDVTLKRCIIGSFHVGPSQIVGGPDWLDSNRFHIEAKAEQPTNDESALDAMLRNLLADRFHLVVDREVRTMTALVLEVGKKGPTLEKGDGGEAVTDAGHGQLKIRNETMDDFAERLARMTDQPVINRTGLSGVFNLKLFWTPASDHPRPDDPPSLFTAIQEQLGLRLASRKAEIPVLVIDHAERPGAD